MGYKLAGVSYGRKYEVVYDANLNKIRQGIFERAKLNELLPPVWGLMTATFNRVGTSELLARLPPVSLAKALSSPQNTQKPSGAGAGSVSIPYPGCVTIGWLLQQPFVATALDEAWTKTEKSGEENGLFAVWDGTNNMVHVITVPQGTQMTTRHGSIPSLDIVGPYKEFIRKLKGPVRLLPRRTPIRIATIVLRDMIFSRCMIWEELTERA